MIITNVYHCRFLHIVTNFTSLLCANMGRDWNGHIKIADDLHITKIRETPVPCQMLTATLNILCNTKLLILPGFMMFDIDKAFFLAYVQIKTVVLHYYFCGITDLFLLHISNDCLNRIFLACCRGFSTVTHRFMLLLMFTSVFSYHYLPFVLRLSLPSE